ncbi:DUF1800 domain-containing protein [Fulvivirgaceae bacterium BMA10]|uniref:DUF1800 domain-containing protein n=1 Tax=Splendidivirga corallicola TaxID=3051826 RepID=A0ABT8KMQ5_9BACT|nr:DUF1800 domain-containing protein [Fulvivirgaceae bacterium BMA10]
MASLNPFGGVLGRENAAHLLRRTTFGPTKQQINQFASLTADQALSQLFQAVTDPQPPRDVATGAVWVNPKPTDLNSEENDLIRYFRGWWLELMRNEGLSIKERMTYFMHTHFTTAISVVSNSTALYYQNALFRAYATGNFKELSRKICLDNAMLIFLDGRQNEDGRPNENFAREFLELYTIGKGPQIGDGDYTNYTEQDVQEAARVLSGYIDDTEFTEMDTDTNLAKGMLRLDGSGIATRHDAGTKTFSSAFGGATITPNEIVDDRATEAAALDELDQLVDMIFNQQETARHICRKLYRFFVYYDITDEIEQDIIGPLADTFRNQNYEIQPVLEQLFRSQHFYDTDNATETDDNLGAIIKSPLDLTIGALRFFEVQVPDSASQLDTAYDMSYPALLSSMDDQGMILYEPPEVAGYPAYHQNPEFNRNWISNVGLARRYQFANVLLENFDNQAFQLDAVSYVDDPQHISDPANPTTLVQELIDDMFPEIITQERFDYFMNDILLDNLSAANWAGEWNNYKNTGDDSNVRVQLDKLVIALMQSPEYQLY